MSRGGRDSSVKVVIINTQYVETDAGSFRSVVQKLTGKDAVVPVTTTWNGCSTDGSRGVADGSVRCEQLSVLDRNWSMGEFDRLLKEMPTVDELCQIWD